MLGAGYVYSIWSTYYHFSYWILSSVRFWIITSCQYFIIWEVLLNSYHMLIFNLMSANNCTITVIIVGTKKMLIILFFSQDKGHV